MKSKRDPEAQPYSPLSKMAQDIERLKKRENRLTELEKRFDGTAFSKKFLRFLLGDADD